VSAGRSRVSRTGPVTSRAPAVHPGNGGSFVNPRVSPRTQTRGLCRRFANLRLIFMRDPGRTDVYDSSPGSRSTALSTTSCKRQNKLRETARLIPRGVWRAAPRRRETRQGPGDGHHVLDGPSLGWRDRASASHPHRCPSRIVILTRDPRVGSSQYSSYEDPLLRRPPPHHTTPHRLIWGRSVRCWAKVGLRDGSHVTCADGRE
jgi:hypothetical protein